jgi:hypothetical protein
LPKPPAGKADDTDMEAIANEVKMREYICKQLPPNARKMFDEMNK